MQATTIDTCSNGFVRYPLEVAVAAAATTTNVCHPSIWPPPRLLLFTTAQKYFTRTQKQFSAVPLIPHLFPVPESRDHVKEPSPAAPKEKETAQNQQCAGAPGLWLCAATRL